MIEVDEISGKNQAFTPWQSARSGSNRLFLIFPTRAANRPEDHVVGRVGLQAQKLNIRFATVRCEIWRVSCAYDRGLGRTHV